MAVDGAVRCSCTYSAVSLSRKHKMDGMRPDSPPPRRYLRISGTHKYVSLQYQYYRGIVASVLRSGGRTDTTHARTVPISASIEDCTGGQNRKSNKHLSTPGSLGLEHETHSSNTRPSSPQVTPSHRQGSSGLSALQLESCDEGSSESTAAASSNT